MNKLSDRNGLNLTQVPVLNRLLLWNGFPYVFQFIFLVVFIILVIMGWNLYAPEGVHNRLFAQTNMVNLLVWGIWWPLMVLTAILFGRLWCMICPLEMVSNFSERLSRKLGVRQKKLNRWVRSGAILLAFYALVHLLIAGIELHRIPAYTSIFLIGLLTLTAVTGFLFSDRAFCRGFCPVGLLLNVHAHIRLCDVSYDRGVDMGPRDLSVDSRTVCFAFQPGGLLRLDKRNLDAICVSCFDLDTDGWSGTSFYNGIYGYHLAPACPAVGDCFCRRSSGRGNLQVIRLGRLFAVRPESTGWRGCSADGNRRIHAGSRASVEPGDGLRVGTFLVVGRILVFRPGIPACQSGVCPNLSAAQTGFHRNVSLYRFRMGRRTLVWVLMPSTLFHPGQL